MIMSFFIEKTEDRKDFIEKAFKKFNLSKALKTKKKILLKPNLVSFENYPTTTHPQTLEVLIKILQKMKKEILVADAPAPDAGNTDKIFLKHPLKKVCDNLGVEFLILYKRKFLKKKSERGFTLKISEVPFEYDYIFSLPVLKIHSLAGITGALKNQFGLLSKLERYILHSGIKNFHRGIAELNSIIKPDFFIVDAIDTYCKAQELRWGGVCKKLGYMLAGNNALELDIQGFKLLQSIEPKLQGKDPESVGYIKFAKEFKL
jgi:uncharacterized protein (DUF362 family)